MERILALLALLVVSTAQAGTYVLSNGVVTEERVVSTVPPGHHAHYRNDGSVLIHGNENFGSASAHIDVARPWVRVAEAGQACPTGGCPTVFQIPKAMPGPAVTVKVDAPVQARRGPIRRFFERFRPNIFLRLRVR